MEIRKSRFFEKIQYLFDFLKTEKGKKFVSRFTIASLVIYLLVAISAYATWFPNSPKYFVYSSTSGIILRILTSVLVIFSGFLVIVSNKEKIKWSYSIPFIVLIFLSFIMIFLTESSFSRAYIEISPFPYLAYVEASVSFKTIALMFFSSTIDFVFGFLFLFVLPHGIKKRENYLILLLLFIIILFYSCLYSFAKQTTYYVRFFKGDWKYESVTIGSIFGNKQQWGIFLSVGLPATICSFFLVFKSKFQKILKILLYCFLTLCSILFILCSAVILCKTAIVANIVFFFVFLVGIICFCFKGRNKKTAISLLILGGAMLTVLILGGFVPQFKDLPVFSTINKLFAVLSDSGTKSADSRLNIVVRFLENFPAVNAFFGIPKGMLDTVFRGTVPELMNGMHTGIAIYFSRTGIIGIVIYLVLIAYLIYKICKNISVDVLFGFLLLATFGSSIILNLSELEILLMSSSMNVLMFNIIAVMIPVTELDLCEEKFYETKAV